MIPHRFRILEAGDCLRADLPALREASPGVPVFPHETGLSREGLSWLLTGPGDCSISGHLDEHFELSVDMKGRRGGVYTVAIYGQDVDGERAEIWRQHVFVQPTLRRTSAAIDELARRYAPIFLFSREEAYFPVDLETLTAAPEILSSHDQISVSFPHGSESVPVRDLHEYLRFNGHCDALLDQSAFDHDQVFRDLRGAFDRSVVYYSYMEDAVGDRFFINYHTFYAFDPKSGIAKLTGVGPHVFDRESLTLVFREEQSRGGKSADRPESLVLSGHMEGQQILFFDSLKMWSAGRVRCDMGAFAPAVAGHAIVPVAEGSHALYPTSGLYHISVLTELAGHLFEDILEAGPRSELDRHQVLLPPSLESTQFADYDLRPLRLDLLRSEPLPASPLYDPFSSVLVFSGYWVDVPGLQNERFPPFSKKEACIEEWVDGAYRWDWADLPERILAHDRALSSSIAALVTPRDSETAGNGKA